MINQILKYPILYRIYQKSVRTKFSEYDFLEHIFKELKDKKIRMLDLCCGDSYILNFVEDYISEYMGVDNSDKYLKYSKNKWSKFKFLNLDLNNKDSIDELEKFQPNLIFMNGAIHHLDDFTMKNIITFINKFQKSLFISVDPVKSNNKILNKIMIKLDRGKFIRTEAEYKNLMQNCDPFVIDDFYKMSFKNRILYY